MAEMTARELASRGGKARALSMSPDQRSELAQKAAKARWENRLPRATHAGELEIGNIKIACYVLENGTRVISHRGLQRSLGLAVSGGAQQTASFVSSVASKINSGMDLTARISSPIDFIPPNYGRSAFGYEATVLAEICDLILAARKAGSISGIRMKRIADNCELLVRGFARVGIIALVDEATGHQEVRDKQALQEILDKYLRKEFAAWAKTFPDEFYKQIFRLRRWTWKGMNVNRPQCVARYTRDLVYARLAPGILKELESRNPIQNGRRKARHTQLLTDDIGHPALAQHLHAIVGLMRAAESWDQMQRFVNRAFPKRGDSLQVSLFSDDELDELEG